MSGRRKQSYCDSYAETFTFIKKSTKGEHHAYCKSCNCDISISAGGANDIKRHMNNDIFCKCILLVLKVYKPMPGAQKSQVSLIVIQIAEVSMFTVYKFTVTEVEVRSIILTFFAVYFSMYKLEFYTFL